MVLNEYVHIIHFQLMHFVGISKYSDIATKELLGENSMYSSSIHQQWKNFGQQYTIAFNSKAVCVTLTGAYSHVISFLVSTMKICFFESRHLLHNE